MAEATPNETFSATWNPTHRRVYLPEQQSEEALLDAGNPTDA